VFIFEADHAGRGAKALFRLEQVEEIPRLFFAGRLETAPERRAGPNNDLLGFMQKRA